MLLPLLVILTLAPTLGKVERKYLNFAFDVLNIKEHDLSYDKIWADKDPFRLRIIEKFLNTPMYVPYFADSLEDTLKKLVGEPWLMINYFSGLLDLELYSYPETVPDLPLPEIDGKIKKPLKRLIKDIGNAKELYLQAYDKLSPGELDTLLSDAIFWWTDEDDSLDDTLRGVILRETGYATPFAFGDTTSVPLDSLSMILKKIRLEKIFSAYLTLIKSVYRFVGSVPQINDTFQIEFDTKIGRVGIGGIGNNVYEGDFALIVDFGGDDRYSGRTGGGILTQYPVSVVIDIRGNDIYRSNKVGSLGSGYLGLGILYDGSGNDLYDASHVSLGAGLLGCGALIDVEGNDIYRGGFFTQGAGNFGCGLLLDFEGNDDFSAYDWAQGFGSVKGVGIIYDRAGNDRYYAGGHYIHHPLLPSNYRSFAQGFAMGWRPDISGGIGILLDERGNDTYHVEVYGQGAGYWLSAGFLIDDQGDDSYHGVEYVQGAGIHIACGTLIDREGKDSYYSRYGPSQGEGHDLSVGWLIDKNGDDNYYVSGGQGAGIYNSVGFFIDSRGKDTYTTSEKGSGQGWANMGRGAPGIGVFLDLQGMDIYRKGLPGSNNRIWLNGSIGVGIDLEGQE